MGGKLLCTPGRKVSSSIPQNRCFRPTNLLREEYGTWASNGSSVEEIWNNFKKIVSECIERFVPHKILRKNPDPEYYSKEVKQLSR
jgi:hypothetical protein